VKFNSAGVRQWGTYYGGTGGDIAYSCATDAAGNVYIVGYSATSTANVISTAGSHQVTIGGGFDAFAAKFNAAGVRQWGTYIGGTGGEYAYSCATDVSSNLFVTGFTNSGTGISSVGSHQATYGG
ncbi:MAG TPA: calcium-binding protein, partial [Bacteroidia bacterium]|nr:calcium-binding protein [Bacteroidia bacterium]